MNLSVRLIAIVSCIIGITSCDSTSTEPVFCPSIAEPAIVIDVTDAVTGKYIAKEATGIIKDGSYIDTLGFGNITQREPVLIVKSLVGGLERAGTYDVRIELEGYQPWSRNNVHVPEGECGPHTQHLEAQMEKL